MCHKMGMPPISTIGLGRISVSSANLVPRPPANIATFIFKLLHNEAKASILKHGAKFIAVAIKHTNQIASLNLTVVVWFQLLFPRLSGLLGSAELISLYLENSGLGPQTVQDMSFHFAKRFKAKEPENGVSNKGETFCSK